MIERLREGRLREASTKRKRERITPYRGEKGRAKEIKMTKKREREGERDKGYTLRSRLVTRERERETVKPGRGCATEGERETGKAHGNKGTKGGKGVDSLVTPAGNDQRGKGTRCRRERGNSMSLC